MIASAISATLIGGLSALTLLAMDPPEAAGTPPAVAPEALAANAAPAEVPVMNWRFSTFGVNYDVKGTDEGDARYEAVRVSTTAPDRPGITIACSEARGLNVALSVRGPVEPQAFYDYSSVMAQLQVEGERAEMFRTLRFEKGQMYQTTQQRSAARIFNAIARGKSFKFDGKSFDPPEVDADFRRFARECPLTSKKSDG